MKRPRRDRAALSHCGPKGMEENSRFICRAQTVEWHKCELSVGANGKITD